MSQPQEVILSSEPPQRHLGQTDPLSKGKAGAFQIFFFTYATGSKILFQTFLGVDSLGTSVSWLCSLSWWGGGPWPVRNTRPSAGGVQQTREQKCIYTYSRSQAALLPELRLLSDQREHYLLIETQPYSELHCARDLGCFFLCESNAWWSEVQLRLWCQHRGAAANTDCQ